MGPISIDKHALILSLCVVASPACGDSSDGSGGDGTGGEAESSTAPTSAGPSTANGNSTNDDESSTNDDASSGPNDDASSGTNDSGPGPIAVVNAGFESPAAAAGSFEIGSPPDGWQPVGMLNSGLRSVGVLNPATTANYAEAVPEGTNVGLIFLQDRLPDSEEAGMEQTLSQTLALGSTYTLEVDVGNISSQPGGTYDFSGFPGYRIELRAGDAVIASDENTLLPDEGRFELSTVSVVVGDSHPNEGERLSIRLMCLDGPNGIEVNFDDVRLTRTEP